MLTPANRVNSKNRFLAPAGWNEHLKLYFFSYSQKVYQIEKFLSRQKNKKPFTFSYNNNGF